MHIICTQRPDSKEALGSGVVLGLIRWSKRGHDALHTLAALPETRHQLAHLLGRGRLIPAASAGSGSSAGEQPHSSSRLPYIQTPDLHDGACSDCAAAASRFVLALTAADANWQLLPFQLHTTRKAGPHCTAGHHLSTGAPAKASVICEAAMLARLAAPGARAGFSTGRQRWRSTRPFRLSHAASSSSTPTRPVPSPAPSPSVSGNWLPPPPALS